MGRNVAPCGTHAAYRRHLRDNTPICGACREAETVYQQQKWREWKERQREFLDSIGRRHTPLFRGGVRLERTPGRFPLIEHGACTAPLIDGAWFHSDNPADIRMAIAVCNTCPVIDPCRNYQEQLNAPGVWGGVRWTPTTRGTKPDPRFLRELV